MLALERCALEPRCLGVGLCLVRCVGCGVWVGCGYELVTRDEIDLGF